MSVSYGGDSITFADGSVTSSGWTGFKNRLINGAMTIDQRYSGAANTINTLANNYVMDRWNGIGQSSDGVFTIRQMESANSSASNYESGSAPAGFRNSAKITVTTADASVGSGQYYAFQQKIEGNNVADLAWGTSSAKTVTLSFWVKSNLTGVFTGTLADSSYAYSYPFNYTINASNTWEYKTVTVAGPQSGGTWKVDNNIGLYLVFSLGTGTTLKGTAGSWQSTGYVGSSSETASVIGTLNNTWYITGVQLEVGSTASSFEYRSYATELALCQRYYETLIADSAGVVALHWYYATSNYWHYWYFKTQKRAAATVSLFSGNWTNATPQIYSGIDICSFNASAAAYGNVTSGNKGLVANSEL